MQRMISQPRQKRDKEVVTLTGAVPVSGHAELLVTEEGETFPKLNEDTDPGHPSSIQPPQTRQRRVMNRAPLVWRCIGLTLSESRYYRSL